MVYDSETPQTLETPGLYWYIWRPFYFHLYISDFFVGMHYSVSLLREEESWYTPDQVLRSSLAHTRPPPRGGQGGVEDKRKVAVRFATGATNSVVALCNGFSDEGGPGKHCDKFKHNCFQAQRTRLVLAPTPGGCASYVG